MDEELVEADAPTVGERLRAAREEKKLSLEDIAAQTRIPQRHLESIETARLGQASRADLHHRFRQELCVAPSVSTGPRSATSCARKWAGSASPTAPPKCSSRPTRARTMPKWLVLRRDRRGHRADRADELAQPALARPAGRGRNARRRAARRRRRDAAGRAAPRRPRGRRRPVVLTATEPAWIQVTEQGKTLFSRACCSRARPMPCRRPRPRRVLKTGKPEALQDHGRHRRSRRRSARPGKVSVATSASGPPT